MTVKSQIDVVVIRNKMEWREGCKRKPFTTNNSQFMDNIHQVTYVFTYVGGGDLGISSDKLM